MRHLQCILEQNDCYKKYLSKTLEPTGIVVHSTDPAGEVISRFVQPYSGQTTGMQIDGKPATAEQMLSVLGKNPNANDWNRHQTKNPACVHAFIGKLADGTYAICQTLPYTSPCWGAGSGPKGTYNGCYSGVTTRPLYVQFEMIEGKAGDPNHAKRLYECAVELCAYLCIAYPTIKIENIVSHKEAHSRGYATDHGDPEGYWKRSGKNYNMAGFRADVKKYLEGCIDMMTKDELEEFINNIIDEKFPELWNAQYKAQMASLSDNDAGAWSKDAREWAIKNKIVNGVGKLEDGTTNYAWGQPLTREQYVTTEYRQLKDGEK